KLKGVGEYTAAAVASFAFNEKVAVVDGNVYRVLARYFGIDEDISSSKGKRVFKDVANTLIPPSNPGEYNQAIMDFGALQCTPSNPDCFSCPLAQACVARQNRWQSQLPVKTKKNRKTIRNFHFLIVKKE